MYIRIYITRIDSIQKIEDKEEKSSYTRTYVRSSPSEKHDKIITDKRKKKRR